MFHWVDLIRKAFTRALLQVRSTKASLRVLQNSKPSTLHTLSVENVRAGGIVHFAQNMGLLESLQAVPSAWASESLPLKSEFWIQKAATLEPELKTFYKAGPGSPYRNIPCSRCLLIYSSFYHFCPVCGFATEHSVHEPEPAKPVSGLPNDDAGRKRMQVWTYLMEYFPDALLAEVEVSIAGNEQHNPGEPLHWARDKSTDQYNTAFRHLWDHGRGIKKDKDGQWHLAKAIWRLKAALQLEIEKERNSNEFEDRANR